LDTRSKLNNTIKRVGSKAAQTGKTPSVIETAIRLSSHNPQSGKTLTEIEADLQKEIDANQKREA
jgi:hypothetical protein